MSKLDVYLGVAIFKSVLAVLFVLVSLDMVFSFIKQCEELENNYHLADALIYLIQIMPRKIHEYLPVSSFIGCMISLGFFAASSELTVIRAVGVSTRQLFQMTLKATSIFIIASVLIGEFASDIERSALMKRKMLRSEKGVYSVDAFWHREGNEFMRFDVVDARGFIYGLHRFCFDDNMTLIESSFAEYGTLENDKWYLKNVTINQRSGDHFVSSYIEHMPWNTQLTQILLKIILMNPQSLSISSLYHYIKHLKKQGLNTGSYDLAFWLKILQPFTITALIFLGMASTFGSLRTASLGLRIFLGISFSLVFIIVQGILGSASLILGIPPVLSVLAPILLCFIVGWFLLKKE